MPTNAQVRVGPAGWSYDDWKGIVYPPGMPRSAHPLTFLAEFFDTIEVNSSFYRPPNPRHCVSWLEKSVGNPRFKFTMKLWERFTHKRDTWATDDEIRQVCDGMAPLVEADKLGALLIQFPWSFKRTPESRTWLAKVVDAFAAYPLALEIRHASWNRPEVYEGLAERGVAFCNIDQPLFANSIEPSDTVTAPVGYVRLHGRNAADWFRNDAGRNDRYNYLYSDGELADWLKKVERIRANADEIYVITNNHYRGQAVVNAFELQDGLGQHPARIPESLVEAYPRLKGLLSGVGPAP
ncbi:MAG: DUF72 domain-containing protein, partial [bacterium]|nr:DUF72 domain-containing protein [bacterium]